MFDPTIFDNIKVVLEGLLYEKDSEEEIFITDRQDLVDLSRMSRTAVFSFKTPDGRTIASITLTASTDSLAKEIMGHPPDSLSISIQIAFQVKIQQPDPDCEAIIFIINKAFRQKKPKIKQIIMQEYAAEKKELFSRAVLSFPGGINEQDLVELEPLCESIIYSLDRLDQLRKAEK